jgi:hypothetical protein
MYDTESAGLAIEENAFAMLIPCNRPVLLAIGLDSRNEQVAGDSGPSKVSFAYERYHVRLGGDAPTLAARTGMPALVARVDIQTEGRHVGIISGQVWRTQKPEPLGIWSKLDRQLQN